MSKAERVPKFPCDVKIYRLYWDEFPDEVGYIGHTRERLLSQRMGGHRHKAKIGETALVYQKMRERGPFQYEVLETFFCQNKKEGCEHEKRWKQNLNADLNMNSPITTREELKEYHSLPEFKESRKEYMKEYHSRPEIKSRTKEYNNEYYSRTEVQKYLREIITCDCGTRFQRRNLVPHQKTLKHQNYLASKK